MRESPMPSVHLVEREFESDTLRNRRAIWIQQPPEPVGEPVGIFLVLDGEYYVAHVRAASIVDQAQRDAAMPPMITAYLSVVDFETRWPESFCNPGFATFVVDELVPWLAQTSGVAPDGAHAIAGLSLTGLSAAHTALSRPGSFARVLCQSASFWWQDGQLARDMSEWTPSDCAFRITVGNAETDEDVDHGKGLIQRQSQLASNQHMRDALVARGHRVSYAEFEGDHSVRAWRADLPASLTALFGDHGFAG